MTKALLAILLATAFAGIGIRFGNAPAFLARNQKAIRVAAPAATSGSFTHPLVFPPVDTNGNVSISIEEGCIQILDGPCTNMWTYGGTYPGLTVRRPTGQTTNVTFTNNLDSNAGEMTVTTTVTTQPPTMMGNRIRSLSRQEDRGLYRYDGLEAGGNQRGKTQFYHDHRMDVTGRNVWMGLTGLYIVDDPADPSTLPSGRVRPPLVIADRQFDVKNQIPYGLTLTVSLVTSFWLTAFTSHTSRLAIVSIVSAY